MTPGQLLDAALRRDGARPLLTWYDDRSGERIELSVATAANWAAKTANFLCDERGLDDSDAIGLSPTAHWLSVVVLLGAWTAGIAVDLTGDAREVVLPGDPATLMRAVLPQPDALLVEPATGASMGLITATRVWTLAELVAAARQPGPGSRVLATGALDTAEAISDAVLTPLACDGSTVLVTNADPEKLAARAQTERVTHTTAVDVAGLPRLRS